MRWIAGTIGLLMLSTSPVGLLAQVVPYDRAAQNGQASPAEAPSLSRPKGHELTGRAEAGKEARNPTGIQSLVTVGGSLAVVLGVFFAVAWMLRRTSPNGFGTLPSEAFEVLGRAALANRQQVHLLRCGAKLLLVSVSATGAQTLTEITDSAEVDRLAGLCRQNRSIGAATALRQVFRHAEKSDG